MYVRQDRQEKRAAFTLMEIIAVVTIIMILAGGAVLGIQTVIAQQRERKAEIDCKTLEKAVMIYFNTNGQYPPSLETLAQRQEGGTALISMESLLDPWGQPYHLDASQQNSIGAPLVFSEGPPGQGKQLRNWKQQ